MINDVTVSNEQKNHPNEGHCPAWCAEHSRVDVGHRDEAISHNSSVTEWAGHRLRVNRWDPVNGGPVEDTLWFDDEQISSSEARACAASLIVTADLLDGEK